MAITIVEVPVLVNTAVERPNWMLNAVSSDASAGEILKAPVTDKHHFIEKISVTFKSGGTNWWKLLDGTTEIVGPVTMIDGGTWLYNFVHPIQIQASSNLKIKTKAAGDIHVQIEGFTEP